MLTVVDIVELNLSVLANHLIISKLDGKVASCIGATSANKVFIRYSNNNDNQSVQYLNIDQPVLALSQGQFSENEHQSMVAIGTASHLLIYHVSDNKIVFNKEVDNGVISLMIGPFGSNGEDVIFIGGDCFLQSFNFQGDECFWSVMSDKVTALALIDYDADGQFELISGTEDGCLRIWKNEQVIADLKEIDAVTFLTPLSHSAFGYALANGTVGVYDKRGRLWRIKSKKQIVSLMAFDVDNDGQKELICGWSHGKIDARQWTNGEVIFKEMIPSGIAAMACADWLGHGIDQLIVCSLQGQLRIYAASKLDLPQRSRNSQMDEDAMRQLLIRKQNLEAELVHFELMAQTPQCSKSTLPTAHIDLLQTDQIELHVKVEATWIHAVVILSESVFLNGESHVTHFHPPQMSVVVAVPLQRHLAADLHVKILAGSPEDEHLQVIESVKPVPNFATFKHVPERAESSVAYQVRFRVQERIQRVWFWLTHNFILPGGLALDSAIQLSFTYLPTGSQILITCSTDGAACIASDQLDLCAELVQHLAASLNVNQLSSEIRVGDEQLKQLMNLLQQTRDLQGVRQRLTADIADQINGIYSLVASADDARSLHNLNEMRRAYAAIYSSNQSILSQSHLRQSNYQQLMSCLKLVNVHVQQTAKCRVGKFEAAVIQASREAIKNQDFDQLIKITLYGADNWKR